MLSARARRRCDPAHTSTAMLSIVARDDKISRAADAHRSRLLSLGIKIP